MLVKGINEKILSFDYEECKVEIKTADAQKSYKDGVTVLVTGSLMGKNNLKRKFVQSFFLAPQDNGYFVLNDIFRYVEDEELLENRPVDGVDETTTVPLTPYPGKLPFFLFLRPLFPYVLPGNLSKFFWCCVQNQLMFLILLHLIL